MQVRRTLAAWVIGVLLGVPALGMVAQAQADTVPAVVTLPAATASAPASATASASATSADSSSADEPTDVDEGVTPGNERYGTFVALAAALGLALFAALWTFTHSRIKDRRS